MLSEQRRYREAGALFAQAASFAHEHGAPDAARQAWGAAGEAFRRDDAIEEAARVTRLALSLPGGSEDEVALQRIQLSGALAEMGQGGAAIDQCEAALEGCSSSLMAVGLDALLGTLLGYGDRVQVEARISELDREGPAQWAFLLRSGQLKRLQGDLAGADSDLASLEAKMAGTPGLEAGLGGVRAERAEVAALRGEIASAASAWEAAREDQTRAGRRALALRCEAGRVRSLCDAGVPPLDSDLKEGLAWARNRGMGLLELDLELAIGTAKADQARLASVRDRCLRWGLRRRAGRAEFRRVQGESGATALGPLQDAASWTHDDEPWRLRCEVRRAEILGTLSAEASTALARSLLPEVERVGLAPERDRLAALLGE